MEETHILKSRAASHWQRIGMKDHHGICVPLSALHHKDTGGIGDFSCLPPVIDWLSSVGMDILQLLPINDTGDDKSPYSLLSAFAINPVYLDVAPFSTAADRKHLQSLNSLEWIDYKKVREAKLSILWKEFKKKRRPQKAKSSWLNAYAQFLGGSDQEKRGFYLFLQKLCFLQMKKVKQYAQKQGVMIKGDLPILLSPLSVDCRQHPDLFLKHLSAGAPPDSFSADGQNWRFPVYDYENKLQDIKKWWALRLEVAEQLYHMYRIDHAVGFFRMWAIEEGKGAREGFFIPKSPRKWYQQGVELFTSFLNTSHNLPIAEDLGDVPLKVKKHLFQLGVPGTKVMRWEKVLPKNYPQCSMTSVSTHDTPTLKEWWEACPEESSKFSNKLGLSWKKKLDPCTQREILRESHHSNSLLHINLLQEYFPLVKHLSWPNQDHERINHPGKMRKQNWLYRFKPSISEFTENKEFSQAIKELIYTQSTSRIGFYRLR